MADITAPSSLLHPQGSAPALTAARRFGFAALALFILLGPAPGQVFKQHSPWLREWIMYSGVGIGLPKGRFIVSGAEGVQTVHTPLQAAGLDRYPLIEHYRFRGRVFGPADLRVFAAPLCDTLEPGSRLSFEGHVGTRQGWQAMQASDVCSGGKAQ